MKRLYYTSLTYLVIAFPKNGSGVDVMMNSPGAADPKSLKELGL